MHHRQIGFRPTLCGSRDHLTKEHTKKLQTSVNCPVDKVGSVVCKKSYVDWTLSHILYFCLTLRYSLTLRDLTDTEDPGSWPLDSSLPTSG